MLGYAAMPDRSPSPALLDELRAQIAREVRGGFAPLEDIAESAVEAVQEDDTTADELRACAERLVSEVVAEVRDEEKNWPGVTDCDRLDRAFAALESGGIVTRQHFTCCQTCGHAEIRDEVKQSTARGRQVLGYAFYHRQDTDRAVDGEGLYIAYGATETGAAARVAIGTLVSDALSRHGLEVVWDGSDEKRIFVRLSWQRRRAAPVLN